MDTSKIMVEKVDILAEMEVLNKDMRKTSISPTMSEKEVAAYDQGVTNTMMALETLITHFDDGEKDRLIYQKYDEQSNVVRYIFLNEALKELEESGQLHLAKDDHDKKGGDNPCQTQ